MGVGALRWPARSAMLEVANRFNINTAGLMVLPAFDSGFFAISIQCDAVVHCFWDRGRSKFVVIVPHVTPSGRAACQVGSVLFCLLVCHDSLLSPHLAGAGGSLIVLVAG